MIRRRGSLLPRQAAAGAASHARRPRRDEAPRAAREEAPRVVLAAREEAPRVVPPASAGQHEVTRAATMAGLAIGPRTVDSQDAARLTSH